MHPQLSAIQSNLASLVSFASVFSIPEEFTDRFGFSVSAECSVLTAHANIDYRDDAESVVAICGELFGSSGWSARFNQYGGDGGTYDWTKKFPNNVRVHIIGASKADITREYPVPPTAFPLMLRNEDPSSVASPSVFL